MDALMLGVPSTSNGNQQNGIFESLLAQYRVILEGPLRRLARTIENEIDRLGVVPDRIDFTGKTHKQNLRQYLSRNPISTVPPASTTQLSISPAASILLGKRRIDNTVSHVKLCNLREMGLNPSKKKFASPTMLEQTIKRHFCIMGHIERTYCVHFDKTNRYAITAADDFKIKVWDLNSGMLRYTFRGHANLISDINISPCNQLMASGGADKHVRIWSLRSGATLQVFRLHTALVTGIVFLPYLYGSKRFLCSFGYDCRIVFYQYDVNTLEFAPNPIVFHERQAPSVRCLSSTHSRCGRWVAVSDTFGSVRIFKFENDQVHLEEVLKGVPMNDRLDSLQWAHTGMAFATASSKSVIGRIWRFLNGQWHYVEFQPEQAPEEYAQLYASTKLRYQVCMICWTLDDRFVVASGTDFKIRIYDAMKGTEVRRLSGHKGEPFHLKAHPIHSNVLISAAHDGTIMIWNMDTGVQMKKFVNESIDYGETSGQARAVLDLTISEDGTRLATVDDMGRLAVYGLSSTSTQAVPREQFFLNDYELIEQDELGFAVDGPTGIAPHLLPMQWLVNVDKDPLEDKWQKKVPGREEYQQNVVCPWFTRSVIPRLPAVEYEQWCQNMLAVVAEGEEIYKKCGAQMLFVPEQLRSYRLPSLEPTSQRASQPVGRTTARSRAALPTLQDAIAEQDRRRAAVVMEGYRSEDDDSYSGSENSEGHEDDDDEHSSDSDFSIGAGRPAPEPSSAETRNTPKPAEVFTNSGRRVQRRVLDSGESEASTSSRPVRRQRKARERNNISTESEDEQLSLPIADDAPSTSTAEVVVPLVKPKRKPKIEVKSSFPDAFKYTLKRRFPYVPQIGDNVVYCKQGHERYLEEVKKDRLYVIKLKMYPRTELAAEEFCTVDEVKYTRAPYRLFVLKLARLNRRGERTGFTFTVKYHDIDKCPDFFILRQHYDQSIRHNLRDGSELEAILDGMWYTGKVERRETLSDDHPDSHWLSLAIIWDNGEDDRISPWDCQPKAHYRRWNEIAPEDDQVGMGDYEPSVEDWPGDGDPNNNRKEFTKRLVRAITLLSENSSAQDFARPVNTSEYPDYAFYVDYCSDLETIMERLSNEYYRRTSAVEQDIRYIAVAAEQFNQPDSQIVYHSRILVEALIRIARDSAIDVEDSVSFYTSLFSQPLEEITHYRSKRRQPEVDPDVLRIAADLQGTAQAREPGWVNDSREALQTLKRQTFAKHFVNADTADDEALRECLLENGDLSTICRDIATCSHPKEVVEQVQKLMRNCREAIDDNRSRDSHRTQQVMNWLEEKMRPIITEFDRIFNRRELRTRIRHNVLSPYNTRMQAGNSISEPQGTTTRVGRHVDVGPGYYRQLTSGSLSREQSQHRDVRNVQERTTRAANRTRNARRVLSELPEETEEEERFNGEQHHSPANMNTNENLADEMGEESNESSEPESEHSAMSYGNVRKRGRKKRESNDSVSFSSSPTPQRRSSRKVVDHEVMMELQELNDDNEENYESRGLRRRNATRSVRNGAFGSSSQANGSGSSRYSTRSAANPGKRARIHESSDEEDDDSPRVSRSGRNIRKPRNC